MHWQFHSVGANTAFVKGRLRIAFSRMNPENAQYLL